MDMLRSQFQTLSFKITCQLRDVAGKPKMDGTTIRTHWVIFVRRQSIGYVVWQRSRLIRSGVHISGSTL